MIAASEKIDLAGEEPEDLCRLVNHFGIKTFKGRQIFQWIHKHGEVCFDKMTDLSKADRKVLSEKTAIRIPLLAERLRALDGTEKFLYALEDGHFAEGVLIPEPGRLTLCVSTQVGCAMGCVFCLTGKSGFTRNMRASEIVGQVLLVKRKLTEEHPLTHLVFMGMGEPLANLDNTLKSVRILLDPGGANFSRRKVTLSTCGLIPGLKRLASENPRIPLAVSLNASNSMTRDRLMPINRTNPMEDLLTLLRDYPLPTRGRITFEYVLIHGINDSLEDAQKLVHKLKGIRCKINLIPLNPIPGTDFTPPSRQQVESFQEVLARANYTVFIRESRGREISAACGQLRERHAANT